MAQLSVIAGRTVVSPAGEVLGIATEVLFAPHEPRAIGLIVERPKLLGVIARELRYVPLEQVRFREGRVVLEASRLPSRTRTERTIGCDWDETVQWRGMPVVTPTGREVGTVADVTFERASGAVLELTVSTGGLGDLAVGRLRVQGAAVIGFDGNAVRIALEYGELRASGGLAKQAATGVTVAKERAGRVAKRTYEAGMQAAISLGRSVRKGKARRMMEDVKRALRDAMDDDE